MDEVDASREIADLRAEIAILEAFVEGYYALYGEDPHNFRLNGTQTIYEMAHEQILSLKTYLDICVERVYS